MFRLATICLGLTTAGPAATHSGRGMILAVDPARRQVTISHDRIDGFMPAMSMAFAVTPKISLAGLAPGMRVEFRLDAHNNRTTLIHLRSIGPKTSTDIPLPPPGEAVKPGAAVPDFALIDQQGRQVRLADLRARVTVVDFIYTRCPLPEVCPRLSANFARLQRRFAGQAVTLLSITLDPQFDTPPILTEYAKRWRANPGQWHFLTGSLADIHRIAVSLGMTFWPEDGSITHTTRTVVIDKQGNLAAAVEGPSYIVDQLGDLIAFNLEKQP